MNDTGFVNGVLAVRIYFADGDASRTPMADLVMTDHSVETICWVNVEDRKKFEAGINGYTLIYDERPKRDWSEWLPLQDPNW